MALALRLRAGHSELLDLPWEHALATWTDAHVVRREQGISRHVVRFVEFEGRTYALKETTDQLATAEAELLRALRELHLPTVEPVGVVTGRESPSGDPLGGVLVTRFLDFALPYRYLFSTESGPHLRGRLLDAGAILLVRLHLAGFFWGDCSLSNVLFRRDAGALMAYLVDAETGELTPTLSDGMRAHDLELATENIAGGLADLVAAGRLGADVDLERILDGLTRRYEDLWRLLTAEERSARGDRTVIERRIGELNEIGFDVEEIEVVATTDGDAIRIRPIAVEEGHHHRELLFLTGLDVQENQARSLLNDIAAFGAWLELREGTRIPRAVAAARWLAEVYEPLVAAVSEELRSRIEPPELFHEVIRHRQALAEAERREVTNEEALASYSATELAPRSDERVVIEPDG